MYVCMLVNMHLLPASVLNVLVKHKFVFKSSHESEKLRLIKAYFVLYSKVN